MDLDIKDNVVTLAHASGRSSKVNLLKGDKLGEGNHGNIFSVEINNCRNKLFAVKQFKRAAGQSAQSALNIWQLLQSVKICTWPTYRLIVEMNAILMTYGKPANEFIVSTTGSSESKNSISRNGGLPIIKNMVKSFKAAVDDALRAGQNKIYLTCDAWFFLLKQEGKAMELRRVFVGDYDNVQISDIVDATVRLRIQIGNIFRLMMTFHELFNQFCYSFRRDIYDLIITYQAKKIVKEISRGTKEKNYWQTLIEEAELNQKRFDKNF